MGFLGDLFKGVAGAVPVAGPLVTGLFDAFRGKEANKGELAAQQMWNDYLGQRQGVADQLIGAGLLDPRTTTQAGTSYGQETQRRRGTRDTSQQIRKVADPGDALNLAMIRQQLQSKLGDPNDVLGPGYASRAAAEINRRSEQATQGARQSAFRRGVRPGAGTLGLEQARGGQIADMLNQLPLLREQLRAKTRGEAAGLAADWQGQDINTRSRFNEIMNALRSGGSNMTTVGSPDFATAANVMMPAAPGAPMETGRNPWLDAGSGLVGSLMQMYANRDPKKKQAPMTMPGASVIQGGAGNEYWRG